jgi:hypothetical protein
VNARYDATPAELAEYQRRTAPVAIPDDRLPEEAGDALWRIANLYSILTDGGEVVHFQPTDEQRLLLICIYLRGWLRVIIPKARQLGFSTLLAIIGLDGLTFRSGFQGALVDKTQQDATKKMQGKVILSWDLLPACIRDTLSVTRKNDSQLSVKEVGNPDAPESNFYGGITYRGGTVEFLWVSEWGWIQDHDRARSREIAAGALPAVERAEYGLCVVETTWSGGLDCELGPFVREALDTPEDKKGPKSWRVLFFPWWTCPIYGQSHGYVDPESAKYFAKLAALGVNLTDGQQRWYAEKRRTSISLRTLKQEYPSVVEECWETVPEGSIYGEMIGTARASGRVVDYFTDRQYPVDTFWDIGLPINTVTWLVQFTPGEIRVVDCLFEQDITMADRVALLSAKGHNYRLHCFPHDAGIVQTGGLSQIAEFQKSLGNGCRLVPRVAEIQHGIDLLQAIFPRLVFNKTTCATALDYLGRYRSVRETSGGLAKTEPVHDRYSHVADALRQMAQAMHAGLIPRAHLIGAVDNRTAGARDSGNGNGSVPRAIMGFRR